MTDTPHDFIAIGLGPFNLSLACLMAPLKEHRCLFLDRHSGFDWHPGMLLEDATLQNPFLADLVSLADPTSPFSYLNYCKEQGALYRYFIRENFYLSRREYNRYCQWATTQLPHLRFNCEVTALEREADTGLYVVTAHDRRSGAVLNWRARKLVLGVGTVPAVPPCCLDVEGAIHSAAYLQHKDRLQAQRTITVVGSGQSAAEIYHDLLVDSPRHGYALHWVTRSPRLVPMEYAKLTLELSTPDYACHFQALSDERKTQVLSGQKAIHSGINAQLINRIYDLLDDRRRHDGVRSSVLTNCTLQHCVRDACRGEFELRFWHADLDRHYAHRTQGLVLATGYEHRVPHFIEGIRDLIRWDTHGRYRPAANYSVDVTGGDVFVQNAGFHGHGLASPDLGMTCLRNAALIRELTGVEYYKVDQRVALQDFSPPPGGPLAPLPASGAQAHGPSVEHVR